MADAKTVSPLLDDFSLGSPFSSHNGIICCPAIHAVTKEKFILKQVSVPESQTCYSPAPVPTRLPPRAITKM